MHPRLLLAASLSLLVLGTAHAADPAAALYSDPQYGFSLRYPQGASVATGDQADGQFDLAGTTAVVVKLDDAAFKGTNLGEASVGVGISDDPTTVTACAAGTPAQGEKATGSVTLGGVKFNRFTFEDAGAGNRYGTTSYRAVKDKRCYEIVEFLHWSAIENYPAGAVKAFDRAKVDAALHAITRSFAFTGKPT
ncbi:MAG TPA: hypothetical protein VKV32_06070 [Stellaceae bacterium]|nr:hypothetical protein [Stellaceae bacterium]